MPLPILHQRNDPGPADLLRLFQQTEARWCEHLGEPHELEVGTAYTNPALDRVHLANSMRGVALPEGTSPESAMAEVEAHFAGRGTRCYGWMMNVAVPDARTRPMVEHLLSLRYRLDTDLIMGVEGLPAGKITHASGLTIIPSRASFRHARALFDESADERWHEPQIAEAAMLHLDDPHWDALLALKDGRPVAHAGVLSMGEVGRIEGVYVSKEYRAQGIGRTMISRVMEICARSLFRHVMLCVAPGNAPAIALYRKFGFATVGTLDCYFAP